MGNRLELMLRSLRQAGGSASVRVLAEELGVSQRTVYNDARRINDQLSVSGVPTIRVEHGSLLMDFDDGVDYEHVLSPLTNVYTDPGMRRGRVLLYLGSNDSRVSLSGIASHLDIARNTVARDIKELEASVATYSLEIQGQPFQGYELVGLERDIRRAMVDAACADSSFVEMALSHDDHETYKRLLSFVQATTKEVGVTFSDASTRRLLVVLFVSRTRLRLGRTLEDDGGVGISALEVTREGRAVTSRRAQAESIMGCPLTNAEFASMAEAFESCSVVRYGDLLSEMWVTFSVLAERIIGIVDEWLPLYRFTDDKELYEGILNHLRPAYRRAVTGSTLPNPMLHLVTDRYPDLHRAVIGALETIAPSLGTSFTEEEAAFFTLFFAASAERSTGRQLRSVRAIVVCGAGMSTSQMLKATVEGKFGINVVGVFGTAEARTWLRDNDVDVVLSTVPFEVVGQRVLVVNPLLTPRDEQRISRIVGSSKAGADVGQILSLVQKHVNLGAADMKSLETDLESLFGVNPRRGQPGIGQPTSLREALPVNAVKVGFAAADRDEAVFESGRLLVACGRASADYRDAMIANARSNGTYIVVSPGVAFPHAQPEDGALNVGFSIVVLEHPVAFGHPSNDPVRIVIGMCAVDRQSHLQALGDLVALLNDRRRVKLIMNASSREGVMRALGLV